MTPRDVTLAVLVMIVWGANFVAIDIGLQQLPPLTFAALRFLAVLLPAVAFVPRPPVSWRVLAAVGALLGVGQFGLLYTALHLGMPPGLASLVLQAQALVTVVLCAVLLHERPTRWQWAGVGVGAVGLVVVGWGRGAAVPVVALVLSVLAATSWAGGNVVTRRTGTASGLGLTVWSALVVPIPLLLLSLALDGPEAVTTGLRAANLVTLATTMFTAYLASLFGYGVWNTLVGRYPAAMVAPFTLLVPVTGMVTAWLVVGEKPTQLAVLGGALVMAGVATTVAAGRSRTARDHLPVDS